MAQSGEPQTPGAKIDGQDLTAQKIQPKEAVNARTLRQRCERAPESPDVPGPGH